MGSNSDKYKEDDGRIKPSKNPLFFVIFAMLWEIGAVIIFGLFFGYDVTLENSGTYLINIYSIVAILLFLVAGFTLMSAYVSPSAVTNMLFSILVMLFTLQNWFIYRCFWSKTGLSLDNMVSSFNGETWSQISFLPTGNDLQTTDLYSTASMLEAVGACLAMFAALSPLLGRIGFVEVFFLSWFGPWMYEINSSIFNKFFIVDNGFGMRAFLFGGLTGLFISLIIGKRQQTIGNARYMSTYHVQALTFIGTVLVCIGYPIFISAHLLTLSTGDTNIVPLVQINCWFAVAASVVGAYAGSALFYKKLYLHDIVFTSLSGLITFSSSSDLNFNSAVPIAVGSIVGFLCSISHTKLKTAINMKGVRLSNDVVLQFIVPGVLASVLSSILQAIAETEISGASYTANVKGGRTVQDQAAWQLMGFVFSLGSALIGGIILGVIMKVIHRPIREEYFNDQKSINIVKREDSDFVSN